MESTSSEQTVTLTADELAALEVGLNSEKADRIYTLEEAMEFVRK